MKQVLCLAWAIGTSLLLAQAGDPAAKSGAKPSLPLFDGHSLSGWHQEGDANWHVTGGAIMAGVSGDVWLRSDQAYTNSVLNIEYRNSPKGNGGVFLRAPQETKPAEQCNPVDAYEFQINDEDAKYATGSIEDAIQRLVAVNPAANRWHKAEVAVRGNYITATFDGEKALDGSDSMLTSG